MVGDSCAFGFGASDDQHTFPAFVEEMLNSRGQKIRYEVLNFGMPGSNSTQNLILLQLEGLYLKPDLVIIYSAGLNDYCASLQKIWNTDYRYGYWREREEINEEQVTHPKIVTSLKRYSAFVRGIDKSIQRSIRSHRKKLRKKHIIPLGHRRIFKLWQTEHRTCKFYEAALDIYENNLRSMVAILKDYKIPTVIITLPILISENNSEEEMEKSFQFIQSTVYVNQKSAVELWQRYNNVARDIASKYGIYLFDAENFFNRIPNKSGYFIDFSHMNDQGYNLLAEFIEEQLFKKGIVGGNINDDPE